MEKILQFIAKETYGKSYRTSKIELDPTSRINYGESSQEIVLKKKRRNPPNKKSRVARK